MRREFPDLVADALLSARSDAIIAADKDGIIRFWSPGAQRIFGFSSDEVVGRSLDVIVPERLRQRHWDGFNRFIETGRSRYGDSDVLAVPAIRKDGTTISVEFTITPLRDQTGRIFAVVAVMRDVSQRFDEMRALKRQLAAVTKPAS